MASRTAPADRYSKVSRRLWTDEWFIGLGPVPCTPHTLWLALLTALPSPVPGLAPVGLGWLSDLLGWSLRDLGAALGPLEAGGRVIRNDRPALIWLPNAAKHNQPQSPNAAKSWGLECAALPECYLRDRAVAGIAASMSEGMRRAFAEGWGMSIDKAFDMPCLIPCDNQEQEQEQEQEQIPLKPPKGGEPLILTGPEPEPVKAKKRRSRSKSIDWTADPRVVAIWPEYKEHVGGTNETPPLDFAKTLGALLTAQPNINVDTLKAMPRWIKQSPQKYCADRREDGYFKAGTLYKQERISDRMLDCESWLKGGAPKALPGRPDGGSAAYGEWMHRYSAVLWRTASVALEVGALKLDTLREQLADGAFGRLLSADEDPCPDAARAIEWLCKKADAEREKRRAG